MGWKSKSALRREYKNNDASRKSLNELFAIRQFLRLGVRAGSFRLTEEATDAICLTPSGTELLEPLALFNQENQASLGKFAVFLTFFDQQLLVDIDNTKRGPLRELVHGNVLSGGLRYPWLFDHILYDRSFDQFAEVPEHLSKEETERLLCDTPPGVFQLGVLSVGPFGLLESEQSRLFRPRSDILLSHCSDATCNHAHVAMICVGGGPVAGIAALIDKSLRQSGDPSEYQEFVAELQVGYSWYDDFSWKNLPWLLGNAFSEPEMRTLLAEVITAQQAQIRSRFPTDGPAASRLKGSAVDIASRLSKSEALQIVMLASDETIVAAIDALVQRGGSQFRHRRQGWLWHRLRCIRGIRCIANVLSLGSEWSAGRPINHWPVSEGSYCRRTRRHLTGNNWLGCSAGLLRSVESRRTHSGERLSASSWKNRRDPLSENLFLRAMKSLLRRWPIYDRPILVFRRAALRIGSWSTEFFGN